MREQVPDTLCAQGWPVFGVVWLASLLFQAAHVGVMAALMYACRPQPSAGSAQTTRKRL